MGFGPAQSNGVRHGRDWRLYHRTPSMGAAKPDDVDQEVLIQARGAHINKFRVNLFYEK